jgi:putative SOS response-associated peptidase YedK
MCGRFVNGAGVEVMRQRYGAQGPAIDWTPSWNITPTRMIPVLLGGSRGRRLGLMHWGWHPPVLGGRLLVNCRGEEAYGKALFRDVLPRRRCLVPATAFYEWQPAAARGQRPQPFAFAPVSGDMVLIGALWMPAPSVGVVRGDASTGAVILMTVLANQTVAPVHDRMPLIIADADMDHWLDPDADVAAARQLIRTDAEDHWRRWAVCRAVSDVRRDGPELIEAVRPD